MSLPQALEEALFESLSTGTFVDVKFYAFSQRTSSGRVRSPKPLYANSHVLKTVPYFHSLLSDAFSEGKLRDIQGSFPSDQPTELDNHVFLDDNDLEDVEDNAELTVKIPDASLEHRRLPGLKSPVFGTGFTSPFSPQISRLGSVGGTQHTCASQPVDSGAHPGNVVVLCDVSFVTLRAVLFFLYTGEIIFAPSSSVAKGTHSPPNARELSACAKSVYRAADKFDIPELKALAMDWIRAKMHSCDVIQELTSNFTTMFPEIREVCLQELANALCADDRAHTIKNLMAAVRRSVHGDPDSSIDPETRGAMFDMLTKGYTQTARPPYASPRSNRPADWHHLREALRESLTSGKFLDGQIKAYRGKGRNNQLTRPSLIYFSTASIPPDTMNKIRYESMAHGPSEPEYDSDSDLEDDEGERSEQSKPQDVGDPRGMSLQHIAVTKYGSWRTWRATLFFMYSQKITFFPIRSQGVPRPPEHQPMGSCSPKSAFVLAEKIAVQRLQYYARQDLLQKVTVANLMTEYFSKFVNSHTPLLHTIDGIVRKTRNAETDAMVRKKLVESTGDDPHVSVALEHFLQRLIEENNSRTIDRRAHTVLDQSKDGKCQSCVLQSSSSLKKDMHL